MKNNRPYFANKEDRKRENSICFGKKTILECPTPECVFHIKSKQCRQKKYSSADVIKEDKLMREKLKANPDLEFMELKNKKHKLKVLNVLQSFIDNYNGEKEDEYLRKIIKKLKSMLDKYEDELFSNLTFSKSNSIFDFN